MEHERRVQKIAMTVWGGRISPVFDSARTLLIAEIIDNDIVRLSFREFDPDRPHRLVQLLRAQGIKVLICGAVSEGPAQVLEAAGFELIPFIAGSVKEVIETFLMSTPVWTELTMPGCNRKICCQGRIRRGYELAVNIPEKNTKPEGRKLIAVSDRQK